MSLQMSPEATVLPVIGWYLTWSPGLVFGSFLANFFSTSQVPIEVAGGSPDPSVQLLMVLQDTNTKWRFGLL